MPGQKAIAVAALLAASITGAQKPALTHWRVVRDAADSGATPRITASVGYLTMGGMRRVDVSFASDTDAYALVGHVAADGTLRIVFPATPRGTGYVHAGDTIVVPTFLGGRDSVVATAKNAARTARGVASDSYDGGASYLFIIASTSPLHMQGMVDGSRWATLTLDRKELSDPRPAINELARTFGAGETHSLTYVRAKDEINTVRGGHRVGPAAQETFRQVPLSDAFDVSAPPPPYLLAYTAYQWFGVPVPMPLTNDAYDAGYASGLVYGYDDGFVSGGWFRGPHFFDGRRHRQDVTCSPLNSSVGLFAPGFPAFGSCNNPAPKYTPAVGLRADQLPSANKAQIVAPAALAAPARMSAESERGTTVFMKAPLGGPIPYQGAPAPGHVEFTSPSAPPVQVVAPMHGFRGYSPYARPMGAYAPHAAVVAPPGGAAGQMRGIAPRQASPARAVAPAQPH